MIRLKKLEHKEVQPHIDVLENTYASWHNCQCTWQTITHLQELLSKYTAEVPGESRPVGFTEAFDKILWNMACILDKTYPKNLNQTWQDVTVICGYIRLYLSM